MKKDSKMTLNRDIAEHIGLNEAIFIDQLEYWLKRTRHKIDDKKWVYNSYSDWHKQFPFWSEKTLARVITNLEDKRIIISGNFNKKKYDRTKWYTINYEKLQELKDNLTIAT